MTQYEKVNGVPKFTSRYFDKDGAAKNVSELADHEELIKILSQNSQSMPTTETGTVYVKAPTRKLVSIAISASYPYINYHTRYMHELVQIVSNWVLGRLARQKSLMRGIGAYKTHVDSQAA